ncbi:class I SAM-dependent methyltransferase [Sunxiuqinia sp. A32]|uniref:class I SAM-dependent methyltransferase n=1 Tax=Sunxiuqinia sp. A32 TaxID=3461496 RepID=UPI0040458952
MHLKSNSIPNLNRRTDIQFENAEIIKLNLGPGPNWKKPDKHWLSVDVDPGLGDIIVNFQDCETIPLKTNSVDCIYGSHVFEHMSIFKTPLIFKELYRVLKKDGIIRLILPDAEKSIMEYINRNEEFELFKRRRERAKKVYKKDYTIFECMREDFLSPSGQIGLLGANSLAHQNAWDFETIQSDLILAGFKIDNIYKMDFQKSNRDDFLFEGTYPSEANEDYRSLYIEAIK